MNDEAMRLLSENITEQSAEQLAQRSVMYALLIALHQSLPPLIPMIREHFAGLTAATPATLDEDGRDQYREAADEWLRRLDSLQS